MSALSTTVLAVIQQELRLFLIAISFLTRIPIVLETDVLKSELSKSQKYFTLLGLMIGLFSAGFFLFASLFFSVSISVILSMIFSICLTGAFHEDGLADTVDGLGGGFSPEQKLKIMKDSRIGAFGVMSLILVLMLKFHLLVEQSSILLAIILGHTLSRLLASSLQVSLDYVQLESDSKVKAVTQDLDEWFLIPGILLSLLMLLLSLEFWHIIQFIFFLLLLRWLFIRVYRAQIGGYTGDTLGAAQQVSEIFIYIFLFICC